MPVEYRRALEQLVDREDALGVEGEELEDGELAVADVDVLAVPATRQLKDPQYIAAGRAARRPG